MCHRKDRHLERLLGTSGTMTRLEAELVCDGFHSVQIPVCPEQFSMENSPKVCQIEVFPSQSWRSSYAIFTFNSSLPVSFLFNSASDRE